MQYSEILDRLDMLESDNKTENKRNEIIKIENLQLQGKRVSNFKNIDQCLYRFKRSSPKQRFKSS